MRTSSDENGSPTIPDPRLTAVGLRVLKQFLMAPGTSLSGAMIAKRTEVSSGTLYPLLARLCLSRWLDSAMEDGSASEIGRPLQRLYTLTPLGRRKASDAIAEMSPHSILQTIELPAELAATIRRAGLLQTDDIVVELIETGISTLRAAGDPRFLHDDERSKP